MEDVLDDVLVVDTITTMLGPYSQLDTDVGYRSLLENNVESGFTLCE